MATTQIQPVMVKADGKPEVSGELHFRAFNSGDKLTRAGGILLACWIAAGITLLIPIAHFILVPGFAIGGLVLAWGKLKSNRENDNITARCPNCDHDVSIRLEAAETVPIYKYCPNCSASLHVTANS